MGSNRILTKDERPVEDSNPLPVKLLDSALTVENANVTVGDVGLVDINDNDVNPATYDAQTDGTQKTQVVDSVGTGLEINNDGSINTKFQDSANLDAFGRLRMSEVESIFDSKQLFDNQPLFWDDQQTTGTGTTSTHSSNTASSTLSVSATTAGTRVRQTYMRFNYQSGKSQLVMLTGVLDKTGGGTGITRSFGYYDEDNGIFLKDDQDTLKVVIRSYTTGTAVDNEVAQSSWNLDTMDGTGVSGITLDMSKGQIFLIDFEWLSVGRVRVGFVINGQTYYVHEFLHANLTIGAYMSTPNLPLRYEISNDGTGVASSLEHICATVMNEGGTQKQGVIRHYDSPELSSLSSDTPYVLMAGRLKSTHLGASIDIEKLAFISVSSDQVHWDIMVGGTYNGTLNFVDVPNSAIQIADGAKTVTHNEDGTDIEGGFFTQQLPSSTTVPNATRLGSSIDGTPQEFYIVVTPITNNVTLRGDATWREFN